MNTPNLERLDEAFARLSEMGPEERARALVEHCGSDVALRGELESLLAAHDGAGGSLDRSGVELLGPAPPASLGPGSVIGAYRIVRVVASGGSGTVYEAEQASPHRTVALKVMHAGLGSGAASRRFQDEAEILARLEHPGIAHVYEAGLNRSGGAAVPWFAMELVAGASSIVEFAERTAMPVPRRLALFESACRAVHHGHQKGIVHRDLKPANVLVSGAGHVKVIDFGIARAGDATAGPRIAGTLPYMAPEQCALGGPVPDVRSDVHALGVLLCEVLTGRLPFDVDGLPFAEALRVVREREPTPASRFDPALAGDVDAIVAKALAKDPERRYASAAALADDLRRHLADEPVEAVAPSLLYQARKFARRRRAAFVASAAVLVVSVAAAAVSAGFAFRMDRERRASERHAWVANLAAAAAALRSDDPAEARQRLGAVPEPLRGWEWRHFESRIDRSLRTIELPEKLLAWGAVSGDGSRLVSTGYVSPDGMSSLSVLDTVSGSVVASVKLDPADRRPYALAVSRDAALVAVGYASGALELRDGATGLVRTRVAAHRDVVVSAAFDPQGRRLATASRDRTVRLWRAASGEPDGTLTGHSDRVIGLAFSPDGQRIASGARNGELRIWDVATHEALRSVAAHEGSVESVAWSPDGSRLVTASRDGTVRLWDVATGAALATGRAHARNVRDVAFSPDGRVVASASYDRTIRLWNATDLHEVAGLRGHVTGACALGFAEGSSKLWSFAGDGSAKEWDVACGADVPTLRGHDDVVRALAFSGDGTTLASAGDDGTLRLWDVRRRAEIARCSAESVATLAFRDGGRRLVGTAVNGSVSVWSVPSGERVAAGVADEGPERLRIATERLASVAPYESELVAYAADARGTRVASSHTDGEVRLFAAQTFELVARLEGHHARVEGIAFSPDGSRVATAGGDETVRLWDAETGVQLLVLHGHTQPVRCIAWSPDGSCLASADGAVEVPGVIRLWETGR